MKKCLLANVVVAKGPIVEVTLAKDNTFVAVNISSRQAILAVTTGISVESTSSSIADFKLCNERAHGFDNANSFVTKGYWGT
jgi:uncharacterized membrane protein